MNRLSISIATSLVALTSLHAQTPSVQVSIGVREVGIGLPFPGLGADGGFSGGIEWINRDGQTLVLDGTWQFFVFDMTLDPVTGFAGGSANGMLEGDWGTLEHIRILNSNDITERITLSIDEIESTVTPSGGTTTTTSLQDFEAFAAGDEVTMQEPCFSGSTARNMFIYDPNAAPPRCIAQPDAIAHDSGVDATGGAMGTAQSYLSTFRFLEPTPLPPNTAAAPGTRWMRHTTFQTTNQPNPAIPFNDSAILTFWMKGEVGSGVRATGACPGVPHSGSGPVLGWSGSAALGDTLTLDGSSLFGGLCGLVIGNPLNPGLPLDALGGLAGSQLCVSIFASVPCGGTSISLPLAIGNDPAINGAVFATQLLDLDLAPTGGEPLPFGTSNTILFVPGNF